MAFDNPSRFEFKSFTELPSQTRKILNIDKQHRDKGEGKPTVISTEVVNNSCFCERNKKGTVNRSSDGSEIQIKYQFKRGT